jgi:hypothetical protein
MPEIKGGFPREWVEFADSKSGVIYKCDLTWLTSNWKCIYGSGCKGIDAQGADSGCCSDGAYYTGRADETRVKQVANQLTKNLWQNFDIARDSSGKTLNISEIGLDNERKTRKINGRCIFLNKSNFPTGAGCAFHYLNQQTGMSSIQSKPDVCWQLPIRRTFEIRKDLVNSNYGNGNNHVVVIGEFTRAAWGEGGAEFNWYCTSNSEAHVAQTAVYQSCKAELIAMMSESAYEELARLCEIRVKQKNRKGIFSGRTLLPLYVKHPASKS